MDYFDFFHPPFSSLATIVANGLSVNQILLRRSPPLFFRVIFSTFATLYFCYHCVQKTLIITTNNTMQKELYEAPTISVVEMKQEGVICASGDVNATMYGVFSEETI